MRIRDYQFINLLDLTGLTYEEDIINYFNIDKSLTITEINEEVRKITTISTKKLKGSYFWFNKKIWRIEKDMINLSYEQFARLDRLIAEGDNTANLHKLLSIYVRPLFKKYSIKTQEKIYDQLLDLDMSITQSILNLFFSLASKYTQNIVIHYLNQQKINQNLSIINK